MKIKVFAHHKDIFRWRTLRACLIKNVNSGTVRFSRNVLELRGSNLSVVTGEVKCSTAKDGRIKYLLIK